MRRPLAAVLIVAVASVTAAGYRQPTPSESARLAMLGRVWLAAKFAHPRVALTTRDWDAALVEVLPKVRDATDAASFAAAVGSLLETLDDLVTRVARDVDDGIPPKRPAGGARVIDSDPRMTILDLRGRLAAAPAELQGAVGRLRTAMQGSNRLVVDLRGTGVPMGLGAALAPLESVLVQDRTTLPSSRHVTHSGYKAQAGGAAFYTSQRVTEAASVAAPREPLPLERVVFVIDPHTAVPGIALALRAAGRAAFLAYGSVPLTPVPAVSVPLEQGWVAYVRTADLVLPDGRVELRAQAAVSGDARDEDVYAAARTLFDATVTPLTLEKDPEPVWTPEASYSEQAYPSEAHRLLAAYRLWGVIDAFFPYKHLLEQPWDAVLEEFIPQVLEASNALEYAQAIARMAARTVDSHVGVSGSQALSTWIGMAPPPVMVRYVEGKPIVTRITDPSAAAGVSPGDEILSVDGEEIAARAQRIAQHTTHSTPQARERTVAGRLLHGREGGTATISLRGADGPVRELKLPRSQRFAAREQRDGEVYRLLDHNIGYADLDRLEPAAVPQMFELFANTAGIIFDMRGYPRGTAWAIAPRINTRKPSAAALFYRPVMTAGATRDRISFLQPLPPTLTGVYTRPTVMLIDERAISQAEHTGLFFKAANGTTFIGSPTMGANGDVTTMVLPGGLRVSFTGHDVRWPDGRQLQRVGLPPDVEVRPTIAGIRAGQDEVLERAVEWLRSRPSGS